MGGLLSKLELTAQALRGSKPGPQEEGQGENAGLEAEQGSILGGAGRKLYSVGVELGGPGTLTGQVSHRTLGAEMGREAGGKEGKTTHRGKHRQLEPLHPLPLVS